MLGKALTGFLVAAMAMAGLALLAGGVQLLELGGSAYYALAGAALIASAVGFWRARTWAAPLYGLLLVATLVWALVEAGLDGWALVPRLIAPAVLGLVLLASPLRRRGQRLAIRWIGVPLGLVLVTFAAATITAMSGGTAAPGATRIVLNDPQNGEWHHWGRSLDGERFSPLAAIDTGNAASLRPAWRFDSNVAPYGFHSFEGTPILANGRLYQCLDRDVVVALDPDSGHETWRYDAHSDLTGVFAATCRGVSYFETAVPTAPCPRRILFGAHDNRLIALDADSGRPCPSFGSQGAVDLKAGLGDFPKGIAFPTSPPVIVAGLAITSGWVTDGLNTHEPSGVIRAYDATSGALRWAWDYGRAEPAKALAPGQSFTRGAPNAWGVFSADPALGLVYVPTGVSTPDYFGAFRPAAAEKYASSIVALDLATGQPRWHFQTVHHDIWDYDIGSQPVLTDIRIGGKPVPALIAPTKRGQFFVLDRRDGHPLYPVTERVVPQDAAAGDWAAKTQPYSGFANVAGGRLAETDMWGATPLDQLWCRIQFRKAHYEGDFTPPSVQTAIHFPGSAGGVNWGSVSIDPVRRLMITNSLYMADIGRLIPREEVRRLQYSQGTKADAFGFIQEGTPYAMKRQVFLNMLGIPCQKPPYGRLTAIDIDTGKVRWSTPLGTADRAGPLGLPSFLPIRMGVPNLGGSLTTAGGLVFIATTQDRLFRAIDIGSGRELWNARLPAIGAATPMTYRSPRTGRQFVVVAAGGHPGLPGPAGGSLIAYAIP